MKSGLVYRNKSNEELVKELQDLQRNYLALKKEYDKTIAATEKQNLKLSQLNQFSVELSNLPPDINLEEFICKRIKELTDAKLTVFSEYNEERNLLNVRHVELESGLLEKVVHLLGKQISKVDVVVSEEMYQMMTTEVIGMRETLYDVSFGSVPRPVAAAIQKLVGVNRFYGIVYMIEGKIFGTSLVGISKDRPDPSRQVLENILFLVAVTLKRRLAEKALKESQTQVNALIKAIPDMMFIQDKEGVYLDYHAPKETKLYAPPELFLGKNMKEVLPPKMVTEFQEVFKNALETKLIQNYEYMLKMPEGEAYFESRTIAYEENRILSLIRDITERKEAELKIRDQNDELIKLNQDKDRFISILAHDLRSPFTSILGLLDLLYDNLHKYNIDKIKKLLDLARSSSHQFYQLLDSLLLWARSQSGKMTLEPQKICISGTCSHILEELQLNAASKDIDFSIVVKEQTYVSADAEMFKTVIRNLVSNAIKFTPKGGKIKIYTEADNDYVTIVISDTGIGIPEENLDKLFNLSSYHKTAGTEGETGSGFGLFLCKELIEKNNGKIWVESKPGKGSKFKISLPVA